MIEQASRDVANLLFFRLFQTMNILHRQAQHDLGISTVQWAVLGALSRPGYEQGVSFNELTEYLVVSRQSLDGVLKRMERDNHVMRIPHPADGRARLVQITEQGKAFWSSLQPGISQFYQEALSGFSLDEAVSMVHGLNKLQADIPKAGQRQEQPEAESV